MTIRKPVKYIAELFKTNDFDPRLAIADSVFGRENNIYAFSIAPLITDSTNYWIQWGGFFDNFVGYGIQIYMNVFLTEVSTTAALISTENSFYIDIDNDIVYMNLTYKPWQYLDAYSSLYDNLGSTFGTAPKDETNPSDNKYGLVKVDNRMKVPSITNQLNDIISGVQVYNSFSIDIDNNDGKYDNFDITKYFNTPLQISKDSESATTIEGFNKIRYGIIDNIDISFGSMKVSAVDKTFLMNSDFCKKFTIANYPNLDDSDINSDIPVGWGTLNKTPLTKVNQDTSDPSTWIEYIALDKDYITAVSKVYDADKVELTFTFTASTGIIKVTSVDGDGEVIEAESADVTGDTDNSLGEIIIKALTDNENFPYVAGIWDVTETNLYLAYCANLGFYFPGGTTRDLVKGVLKNDNAFLIQKNNGLLTIRRWGENYDEHYIPSWAITKKPDKDFSDASKYFCSSAKIQYNKIHIDDNYENTYIDDTLELSVFSNTRRSYMAEFQTELLLESDAEDLASRLLERFSNVRETLKIGVGLDTYAINLLDKISIEVIVNGRTFSEYSNWIVKEVNPGQDEIVIEGLDVGYILTFDGYDATLDGELFEVTD